MNYEYLSLESAEDLHKSKQAQADNKKLKIDNELYKHLYEIELKRNKELQEERNMYKGSFETMSKNYFEEKSRIDKAIEYIWSTKYEWGDLEEDNEDFDIDVYKLLNILQGEDTNVKDKR